MSLDVLFKSIGENIRRPDHPDLPTDLNLLSSLQANDSSEAQIYAASTFLDSVYGDDHRGRFSRAQTPMTAGVSRAQTPMVRNPSYELPGSFPVFSYPVVDRPSSLCPPAPNTERDSNASMFSDSTSIVNPGFVLLPDAYERSPRKQSRLSPSKLPFWNRLSSPQKKPAKSFCAKESLSAQQPQRRPPLPPRPSVLPQIPDVSSHLVEVNPGTDYVVLISMYEVYNDRIFDLLSSPTSSHLPQMTTRQGAIVQKALARRPLLFKNTEMSPDRKVVAGLRKVVCGSYDDAMMVLEAGLIERRVAGTGSNSVSSRSHGFFCIEVKQCPSARPYGRSGSGIWTGGTLSVVDLAGSERARNAKTTGSTLAEAGKINESLMYLGQCLQVQSDCQQDGSKPIVPFRQCKLTELLFSNSFPSHTQHSTYRTPQRATMIVTADPHGDFNATSQILRYSALAREVTVPRIPSVTSTILQGVLTKSQCQGGRTTPNDSRATEELDRATQEITHLNEECEFLSKKLTEEEIKYNESELRRHAAEERIDSVEQQIREEVWAEMEERMEEERLRWREMWERERGEGERYLDGKIDILQQNGAMGAGDFVIHEDEFGERMEEVQRENESLKRKVAGLERELAVGRSPTKKRLTKVLRSDNGNVANAVGKDLGDATATHHMLEKVVSNPFLAGIKGKLMLEVDGIENGTADENDEGVTEIAVKLQNIALTMSPRKASLRNVSSSLIKGNRDSEGI